MGTFSAHKNTDQTGLDNGPNQITFDHVEYDPSNWFSNAADTYTPKLKGYYRMHCQVFVDGGITNKHATLWLYKNAGAYKVLDHVRMITGDDFVVAGSAVVKSDGNDYWGVYLEHDGAPGTINISAPTLTEESNFFEGELIAIQGA